MTTMLNFKTISTAAALLGVLVGAQPAAAASPSPSDAYQSGNGDGSSYRLTVVNNTNLDLWITWYKDNHYTHGQAGTQCIPPGMSNYWARSGWQYTGTVVRAELKSDGRCGGSSLVDTNLFDNGQTVDSNGNEKLRVTTSNNSSLTSTIGY